jgi:hypothetical protein
MAKDISQPLTVWIVALDAQTVQLFIHQPGHPVEPLNVGCCCPTHAGNPDNLAKYLDAALACGKYEGIVLIGLEDVLKGLKGRLSDSVHNRVIAEIFEDITGKDAQEIMRYIAERITPGL